MVHRLGCYTWISRLDLRLPIDPDEAPFRSAPSVEGIAGSVHRMLGPAMFQQWKLGQRLAQTIPPPQFDPVVTTSAMPDIIEMPGWRPIAKRAGTTLVLVSLLPMAVFYTSLSLFGLRAAVLTTVGWYYAGLLLKVFRRKPVLAAAMLGAGLLSIRAVITFLTGSAFLYFLQPVAGTVATATVFAASALAGRPVLDRLAHEFCPFPAEVSARLRKARFFSWLSAVWSATYFINAVGTVWLLVNSSLTGFIVVKSVLSPLLVVAAIGASYVVFRRTVRHQNVTIRWAHHQPWAGAAAATA